MLDKGRFINYGEGGALQNGSGREGGSEMLPLKKGRGQQKL